MAKKAAAAVAAHTQEARRAGQTRRARGQCAGRGGCARCVGETGYIGQFINGWDLVDLCAAPIVGAWLADKPAERKRILD